MGGALSHITLRYGSNPRKVPFKNPGQATDLKDKGCSESCARIIF